MSVRINNGGFTPRPKRYTVNAVIPAATPSTAPVTLLSLTGKGRLKYVYCTSLTQSQIRLTVTIDGKSGYFPVLVAKTSGGIHPAGSKDADQGGLSQAVPWDAEFNSSLLIQGDIGTSSASSNHTITIVYEK